jgi:hypothetical protein
MGVGSAATVSAQNATRELPDDYTPGATFTVAIALSPPGGTAVVGVEEKPPLGWVASNISHSGTFDGQTKKIKWGPFFGSSIPSLLTYDVKPSGASGEQCFTGTASFDGLDQPISGEFCFPHSIPTLSGVGMAGLTLPLLLAGAIILSRTKRAVHSAR